MIATGTDWLEEVYQSPRELRTLKYKEMEKMICATARMNPEQTSRMIESECDAVKAMLLDKNKKYGNSALDPIRVFSSSDPCEQIKVRIDDKLSRIRNQSSSVSDDEDAVMDLIGYLILFRIAGKMKADK